MDECGNLAMPSRRWTRRWQWPGSRNERSTRSPPSGSHSWLRPRPRHEAVRRVSIAVWGDLQMGEALTKTIGAPFSFRRTSISFSAAPAPLLATPKDLKTASLADHLPANAAWGFAVLLQYSISL